MSLSPADRHELDTLLAALREGRISKSQSLRLNQMLRQHSSARSRYLRYFYLASLLYWLHEDRAAGAAPPPAAPEDSPTAKQFLPLLFDLYAQPPGDSRLLRFWRSWRISPRLVGLAVSLLLVGYFVTLALLLAWQRNRGELAPQPVAVEQTGEHFVTLGGTRHCDWRQAEQPTVGTQFQRQPIVLDGGLAELVFASGARVILEGPARFEAQSANSGFLRGGKLTAVVPPSAIGFEIVTPTARIVDLGTEFGVHVQPSGTTETEVFRGAVEVVAVGGDPHATVSGATEKTRLVAGQAARVLVARQPKVESMAGISRPLVRALPPDDRAEVGRSAYVEAVIQRTRPTLYWDFANQSERASCDLMQSAWFDRSLGVSAAAAGPIPAQGLPGMSAENTGLNFDGRGYVLCDHLATLRRVSSNAYSVQVWFNSSVAFGRQPLHFLFGRGNEEQADALCDSVLVVGSHLADGGQTGQIGFVNGGQPGRIHCGKAVLEPGTWYQATFVRNGDNAALYLNGQLAVEDALPWHGGRGELLTFGHRVDHAEPLGWYGQIDEAAAWDRALSAAEISTMYQVATVTPTAD